MCLGAPIPTHNNPKPSGNRRFTLQKWFIGCPVFLAIFFFLLAMTLMTRSVFISTNLQSHLHLPIAPESWAPSEAFSPASLSSSRDWWPWGPGAEFLLRGGCPPPGTPGSYPCLSLLLIPYSLHSLSLLCFNLHSEDETSKPSVLSHM